MIQIYPDYEQMSLAAADCFILQYKQAIARHDYFSMVLSGGHTPKRTYEILAKPPFLEQVKWEHIYVFWGDERCVPPDDSRSNEHMARQAFLDQVPIPPRQIYPMRCAGDADAAAVSYEKQIRQFFKGQTPRFDLVFLGLGENGHTASLFPFQHVLSQTEKWIVPVYLADQDMHRLTMTPTLINQGDKLVFLVSGAEKAPVLQKVLFGPRQPLALPAQLIQPDDGEIIWLVDEAAALLIHHNNPLDTASQPSEFRNRSLGSRHE